MVFIAKYKYDVLFLSPTIYLDPDVALLGLLAYLKAKSYFFYSL